MKIIALETSAKSVSVAAVEDGKLLAQSYQNTGLTHSCTLMPLLDGMLRNAGMTVQQADLFAVSSGPGSFTGLRIGVSALKGLAWAEDKPCCGVSTLEAMAYNGLLFEGILVCAMDARRSQVYNALFRCREGQLERLCPDRAIGLAELTQELSGMDGPKLALGDGAELCAAYLNGHGVPCRLAPMDRRYQTAAGVAFAAEEMARRGQTISGRDLVPTYLRLSQAERERLEKGLPITVEKAPPQKAL